MSTTAAKDKKRRKTPETFQSLIARKTRIPLELIMNNLSRRKPFFHRQFHSVFVFVFVFFASLREKEDIVRGNGRTFEREKIVMN